MALIFHSLKVEYSVEFSFLIGGKLAARFTSPNNNTLVVGKGVLTIEVVPFEVDGEGEEEEEFEVDVPDSTIGNDCFSISDSLSAIFFCLSWLKTCFDSEELNGEIKVYRRAVEERSDKWIEVKGLFEK